MGVVTGNMNPHNCYPCCCSACTDCSSQFCFTSANCTGTKNTCSRGSCGTCNNGQVGMAYTKLNNGCNTSGNCRPLPTLVCNSFNQVRDYSTGRVINSVKVVDCGPNQNAVCNMNFIGCLNAQAWLNIGHSCVCGGPDSVCVGFSGSQCPQ